MSPCASCGAAGAESGPFCPVCGADAREAVEWLGTAVASGGSSPSASTTLVRSGGDRSNALMVGVGLVAVMLRGWATLGGSGGGGGDSAAPSTTLPADAAPGDATTTTEPTPTEPTTTTAPRSPATTTTTEPARPAPVLGYEVGLVAIGDSTIVDLDTGRRLDVDLPGSVVGAGDGFVLTVESNGSAWALPLADLAGPALLIAEDVRTRPLPMGRSRTEGAVWVSGDEAQSTWRLVDLATGSTLDEIDAASNFWSRLGLAGLGPELASPLSGGVFEWGTEGYRRVRDGYLLTVSGDTALVSECDDAMRCSMQRYSIADWSALGDPVESSEYWAGLLAMGRILVHQTDDARGVELLDLQTGTEVDGLTEADTWESFHSDDSGRFLCFRVGNVVRLLDLDTGANKILDLFGEAILVSRADVASLLEPQS